MEQRSTESAVLPSEIEPLPDLTGYLKLASRAEWRRVRLRSGQVRCPATGAREAAPG